MKQLEQILSPEEIHEVQSYEDFPLEGLIEFKFIQPQETTELFTFLFEIQVHPNVLMDPILEFLIDNHSWTPKILYQGITNTHNQKALDHLICLMINRMNLSYLQQLIKDLNASSTSSSTSSSLDLEPVILDFEVVFKSQEIFDVCHQFFRHFDNIYTLNNFYKFLSQK